MVEAEHSAVPWRDVFTRVYGPSLALVCLGVWLHAGESSLPAAARIVRAEKPLGKDGPENGEGAGREGS